MGLFLDYLYLHLSVGHYIREVLWGISKMNKIWRLPPEFNGTKMHTGHPSIPCANTQGSKEQGFV